MIKCSEVHAGDVLIASGIHCLDEGEQCVVHDSDQGPFIRCRAGRHYLDIQLDESDTAYIGFTKPTQSDF